MKGTGSPMPRPMIDLLVALPEAPAFTLALAGDPKTYAAVVAECQDDPAARLAVLRAIVAHYRAPQAPAQVMREAVHPERAIDARIVAWLLAQNVKHEAPKHFAPGDVRKGLGTPEVTDNAWATVLKRLQYAGTIKAEGKGAGRRIWLA